MKQRGDRYLWFLLRVSFAWLFLWAFFDKLLGLGFSTTPDKSWLLGTSPTTGFLLNAAKGPFVSFFNTLGGSLLVDWLFMIGLFLIGLALLFGVAMRLACYSGSLLFFLMWLAVLPPTHNPLIDEHIIYLIMLLILSTTKAGSFYGLGRYWSKLSFVKKYPFFE